MSITATRFCDATGCDNRIHAVIAADSVGDVHKPFRAAGWSCGPDKGGVLCPDHVEHATITIGVGGGGDGFSGAFIVGGGNGGGNGPTYDDLYAEVGRLRRQAAKRRRDELAIRDHFPNTADDAADDPVRALIVHARFLRDQNSTIAAQIEHLTTELRARLTELGAIRDLLPEHLAHCDEDPDTVDVVRRLVDEYGKITAAHANAADDRDTLRGENLEAKNVIGAIRGILRIPLSHADQKLPGILADQMRNLREDRVTHSKRLFELLNDVREALGAPADLNHTDLPAAVRGMVQNLDRATEDAKRWGALLHEIRKQLGKRDATFTELPDLLAERLKTTEQTDTAELDQLRKMRDTFASFITAFTGVLEADLAADLAEARGEKRGN